MFVYRGTNILSIKSSSLLFSTTAALDLTKFVFSFAHTNGLYRISRLFILTATATAAATHGLIIGPHYPYSFFVPICGIYNSTNKRQCFCLFLYDAVFSLRRNRKVCELRLHLQPTSSFRWIKFYSWIKFELILGCCIRLRNKMKSSNHLTTTCIVYNDNNCHVMAERKLRKFQGKSVFCKFTIYWNDFSGNGTNVYMIDKSEEMRNKYTKNWIIDDIL